MLPCRNTQPVRCRCRPIRPASSCRSGRGPALPPNASAFPTGIELPAPADALVGAEAAGKLLQNRHLGADSQGVDVLRSGGQGQALVTRHAHRDTVAPALAEAPCTLDHSECLGRIGRSGISYGTHLHPEVRVAGKPIEPEPFFATMRCKRPAAAG
jgi:hypothetical protein